MFLVQKLELTSNKKVYTNQAGEEKTINDLDYFIDYDEKSFSEVVNDKDIPF